MFHLIRYNLLVKLKNFSSTFWPLVFPILLGTMFYFAFGNINDADFNTVSVGIVKEDHADPLFLMFLNQVENGKNKLISSREMSSDEAYKELNSQQISGIYFVGDTPALTVASNGIEESILQAVLSSYETGKDTIKNIGPYPSFRCLEGDPANVKPDWQYSF